LDTAGVVVRGAQDVMYLPISQYDPATNAWLFPREYVRAGEERALGEHIAGDLLPFGRQELQWPARRAGELVIDLHHRDTQAVRREMAAVLRHRRAMEWLTRTGVAEQLAVAANEPGRLTKTDGFTFCYPTLSATGHHVVTHEPVGVDDQITEHYLALEGATDLTLCYAGVQIELDDKPDFTVRTSRVLDLAHRSEVDPTAWMPNLDVITPQEWEDGLYQLPHMLMQARERNRLFSPLFGAVAYNNQYD
ncbi:MAG TPA: hypothetical protein VF466_03550, partial [Candidatus Saccharimonadales bacterium]